MKTMSFAEINDLENGQPIPSLTGRVKKVFDQLSGDGQYGTWWLQSFILTDQHENELRCTWSGEDTVDDLEGQTILIESGRDKKDQLVGVKKEIRVKNGKRYEGVKLDDRCKIKKTNGENVSQSTSPPPAKPQPATETFGNVPPQRGLDERQRAIVRQHSQSMTMELLKLKQALGELTVEDLHPKKLTQLSDYFDADVLG